MGYIYKLIDEKELQYAQDGKISLSHPIFEFKGTEGKFINFAKRIYDRYLKIGLEIKPTDADIQEITQWFNIFKSTYPTKVEDKDIISESMIVFCGIVQGFCGYFSKINLFDKEQLICFLEKNKLRDKKYVLELDDSVFENHHWRTDDLNKPFTPFYGDSNDFYDYNGFTHPTDIVYNANYNDYTELLKIYNGDEIRSSHNWFNNLSKEFEWQKEERIIFLLQSLEKNCIRVGCDHVYHSVSGTSSNAENVYRNMVDAIDYCEKGPRYVYLKVGTDYLKWISIEEILK